MLQNRVLPTLLVIAALLPILYVVAPLVHLTSSLSWHAFGQALVNPDLDHAILTSLTAGILTTAASVVFGLPTAYLLSLRHFWGKRIIESLLLLPIILPPVIGGMSQLFLYGPMTLIGSAFAHMNLPLTDSVLGVVLAQTYITSPFLILTAKAGFEEVPIELKEATRILGGGFWHNFWYVCVPLAKSAIFSGIALTFARAVGEFGATMIMAYHPYTLPVDIWVQFTSGGLNSVIPITAVVTIFAFLIALLSSLGNRRKKLI